jgi:type IV secretory pathway VirB6-like protein
MHVRWPALCRASIGIALMSMLVCGAHAGVLSDLKSGTLLPNLIDSVLGKDLIATFKDGAMGIANGFLGGAKVIAGALALASLIWNLLIAQINREPAMPVVAESLIFAIVTAALLASYSTMVDFVTSLGSWAASQANGSVGTAATTLFGSVMQAIVDNFTRIGTGGGSSWWDILTGALANAIDVLFSFLVLVFALIFVAYSMVELVSVVLIGPVILGLAIAVGPLFVAMLASHWTRRWFEQWFNFLVNGAFLYAITVIVVTLVATGIGPAMKADTGATLSGQAIAIALLALGLGKIFSSIPAFADGLFPGRTAAGSAITRGRDAAAAASGGSRAVGSIGKGAAAIGSFVRRGTGSMASAGTSLGASMPGAGAAARALSALRKGK